MEANAIHTDSKISERSTAKMLLWIGIISIIMLFSGLTSAYIVRQEEGNWTKFQLPQIFWLSTSIIILSSVSLNWALSSAKKNNTSNISKGLAFTLLLGISFVVSQFMAWKDLVSQNIFMVGNPSGSFLYVISGLHLAHLIGGLICLSVVLAKGMNGKYNSQNLLGIQLCSIYWHFLTALWVYLFFFLMFVR